MTDFNKEEDFRILFKTTKVFKRKMMESFTSNNISLSPQQFFVLKMIAKSEHVVQQDLAEIFECDKSAVLRQLDVLQKNMLVARIPDETDKRRKYLVITHKGNELLNEAKRVEEDFFENVSDGISNEDGKVFKSVMNKIYNNMLNKD